MIKSTLLVKMFLVSGEETQEVGPVCLSVCLWVCPLFSDFYKERFWESNNIMKVTSQQGALGIYHCTFVQCLYMITVWLCTKQAGMLYRSWD